MQAAAAQRAITSEPVFVPKTVILELEWILRSAYQQPPAAIVTAIEGLLGAAGISIEDAEAVNRALAWFKQGFDLKPPVAAP